jgi:hypothetical protein
VVVDARAHVARGPDHEPFARELRARRRNLFADGFEHGAEA